jgi:hypothetical protein
MASAAINESGVIENNVEISEMASKAKSKMAKQPGAAWRKRGVKWRNGAGAAKSSMAIM